MDSDGCPIKTPHQIDELAHFLKVKWTKLSKSMKEQVYQVNKLTSASIYANVVTETLFRCSQDQRMSC